jgi:hypothetical protein
MARSNGLFAGIALGAAFLLTAGSASATTFLLHDTGTGLTDILNTTGELTGGDAKVPASFTGTAFTDISYFTIAPGELLTSYDVTTQATVTPTGGGNGIISGGSAEIYQISGMTHTPIAASLINLASAPPNQLSTFSNSFDLGPGSYFVQINSFGLDVAGQKSGVAAKYSVELQGTAVPEPATWAAMLVGFGAIGVSMRSARRKRAAATV